MDPTVRLCDDDIVGWGKFKKRQLKDVPAWWLIMVAGQPWMRTKRPSLLAYIEHKRPALEACLKKKRDFNREQRREYDYERDTRRSDAEIS